MPRELPGLVGEPLGFDEYDFTFPDGTSVKIERAYDITDLCPRLAPAMRVLLCFTTSPEYGLCAMLVESKLLKGRKHAWRFLPAVPCSCLYEAAASDPRFESYLETFYGLPLQRFSEFVRECAQQPL